METASEKTNRVADTKRFASIWKCQWIVPAIQTFFISHYMHMSISWKHIECSMKWVPLCSIVSTRNKSRNVLWRKFYFAHISFNLKFDSFKRHSVQTKMKGSHSMIISLCGSHDPPLSIANLCWCIALGLSGELCKSHRWYLKWESQSYSSKWTHWRLTQRSVSRRSFEWPPMLRPSGTLLTFESLTSSPSARPRFERASSTRTAAYVWDLCHTPQWF